MKKAFLLIPVLVLSMYVFANHRISVSVNPYEFQFFVQHNVDSTEYEHSFYGVGGGISYDWNFYKGFRVTPSFGGGFSF